jgi:addiction module RelE/StbE family toxin
MYKIEWSLDAIEDIEGHQKYIEEDAPHAASRWIEEIFSKEELLRENAFIGRVIPEENKHNRRELIVGNFRLMYEVINESKIVILKVMRSKQIY